MKKAPIGGLLYQEYYQNKNYIRNNLFIAIALSVTMLLALGSFRYGNLRLLPKENREMLLDMFLMLGKYGPIFAICSIPGSCIESSIKMENAKWKRFRLTLPVSGFRLAAARYLFFAIMTVISLLLAIVYFLFFNRVYPGELSIGCIGLGLALFAFMHLLATTMGVYGILFSSTDKAGLASCATVFLVLLLFYRISPGGMSEETPNTVAHLETWGADMLPYMLILLCVCFVGGFLATGFLFQRREK